MDGVLLEPIAPPPTGRRVRIQYIDGSWRRTERVIEPLRTFRGRLGETYIEAFCHLRGERRTFRLDRIASWVVEDVQERVSARPPAPPPPQLRRLARRPPRLPRQPPRRARGRSGALHAGVAAPWPGSAPRPSPA